MLARSHAAQAAREASSYIASGEVIAEASAEDVDNIPMWKQGDAMLATEENMVLRKRLRYDRRVLAVLQLFWEAAQRSLQAGGNVDADALHQEGHAMVCLALPTTPRPLAHTWLLKLLSSPRWLHNELHPRTNTQALSRSPSIPFDLCECSAAAQMLKRIYRIIIKFHN